MDINQQLQPVVAGLLDNLKETIEKELKKQLATININLIVNEIVKSNLADIIKLQNFPEQSIAHTAINFQGFKLSGNNISSGIIEQFGSTGIEDRASFVQMTLMDHAVAFEGPVFAPSAEIKGALTIDGMLTLNGTVSLASPGVTQLVDATSTAVVNKLDAQLFTSFSDIVFGKMQESGIDLNRITQNGKEVVNGPTLGYHIVDSNLQRVGIVKDLQTSGENLLSDTLYVTQRRVGVNTMDPSAVFVVWDEEVEMIVAKRKQDIGYIGTARKQQLILGSNNKENIVLDINGNTQIENLVVGRVAMTSSTTIPNYAGEIAQIVYNELPSLGSPIGWVCIGGSRWAKFGIIA